MVETSAWMFHHDLWRVFGKLRAKRKNSGASCLPERRLMERLITSFWLNSRWSVLFSVVLNFTQRIFHHVPCYMDSLKNKKKKKFNTVKFIKSNLWAWQAALQPRKQHSDGGKQAIQDQLQSKHHNFFYFTEKKTKKTKSKRLTCFTLDDPRWFKFRERKRRMCKSSKGQTTTWEKQKVPDVFYCSLPPTPPV